MVSFKSLAAAAATTLAVLPSSTMAYVSGFSGPAGATAGSTINVTLDTASYPQNWEDFALIFGLATPQYDCDVCIGSKIGYVTLTGKEGLAYPYNFTQEVKIPASTASGSYILKVAIPRLVGASGTTGYSYYSSNITISPNITAAYATQAR